MKIYELMAKLEKLPSGYEVICAGIKSKEELEEEKFEGDKESYQIDGKISEVDCDERNVYLLF